MTAYQEILAYHSKEKFNEFRLALVSNKRGTLSSGTFSDSMSVIYDNDSEQLSLDGEVETKILRKLLFLKHGQTQHPGLVFDPEGTQRAMSIVANNGILKLNEEFATYLKFGKQEDKDNWLKTDRLAKRKCLTKNVEDLIKKTDINYRTHGDRLHYFVVGLVTVKTGKEVNKYPLFLFSCTGLNKHTLEAEAEATGFLNFWLDKNTLENAGLKALGHYEISLNEEFATTLNTLTSKISALQSGDFDEIIVDPKYSALTIVTGFEAEYIDPVWEKIV